MSAALPLKIYPPMFNRYAGGQSFGSHVDNALTNNVPGWAGDDPSDSCIVRIKKGETDFDLDYYVDMDAILDGVGTTLIDGTGDFAYIMKYEGPASNL